MAQAKVQVTQIEGKLADFFAGHSHGQLTRQQALDGVADHISHLLDQADQYAAKDYEKSDTTYRRGVRARVQPAARRSATALLTPTQAKATDTPTWRLRSALTQLLGEHVELVIGALRAGATDAPDFKAAADCGQRQHHRPGRRGRRAVQPGRGPQLRAALGRPHRPAGAYSAAVAKGDDAARAEISTGSNGFEGRLRRSSAPRPATSSRPRPWPRRSARTTRCSASRSTPSSPRITSPRTMSHTPRTRRCSGLSGQLANAFGRDRREEAAGRRGTDRSGRGSRDHRGALMRVRGLASLAAGAALAAALTGCGGSTAGSAAARGGAARDPDAHQEPGRGRLQVGPDVLDRGRADPAADPGDRPEHAAAATARPGRGQEHRAADPAGAGGLVQGRPAAGAARSGGDHRARRLGPQRRRCSSGCGR